MHLRGRAISLEEAMVRVRPFLLLLFALAVVPGSRVHAETIVGTVVAVADGDTLTLDSQGHRHTVRLNGIDAPERGHPEGQPFGTKARDELRALALHQVATLDTAKQDRYGREVGTVEVAGKDLGLALLQSGHAWVFRRYVKELPGPNGAACGTSRTRSHPGTGGLQNAMVRKPPYPDLHAGTAFDAQTRLAVVPLALFP
jgi:endonuclease YncB( thermonuclease family)